jgi:Fe-S oxidoreductase
MKDESKSNKRLPNREYFELCASCGICNDYCTVNVKSPAHQDSNAHPQQIAKYLLDLENQFDSDNKETVTVEGGSNKSPIYFCTACDFCHYVCPYFVPFLDYLIEAREWNRNMEIEQPQKSILDMERDIFQHGNPFGSPDENRDEWIKEDFPELEEAEVVYYPGCQNAYQLFHIEKAILKVLKLAGVKATYPGKGDKCCGRPLYFSGRRDDVEGVARSNVKIVNEKSAKVLLASCSSCYLAFIKDYPPLIGKPSFEIYHTAEYFNILYKDNRLKFSKPLNKTIIYHDPCEIGRVGGIFAPPRELLNALPGAKVLEFDKNKENGLCCGGGGLFEAVDEDQAYYIGEQIVLEADHKGADILVTACPTCNTVFNMSKTNLKKMGKMESKLKVLDISEVVLKCI